MAIKKNQKSKGQKRKQQQRQQKPKKRELLDPNAGPDGLGALQLQNLVRAAQKHQVGDWQGFIKSVAPKQKKTDPAAHTEEVLRAFVKHLQEVPHPHPTNPAPAGNKGTQPISSATFVQRYVKWVHQLQKEQILKATSVVPPSVVKAFSPAPADPPSTSGSAPNLTQKKDSEGTPSTAHGAPGADLDDGGAERLTSPWGLVHASRNHPRFRSLYSLPSYMPGWARTKRHVLGAPPVGTLKKGSSKMGSSKAQSNGTQGEGEGSEVRGLQPRLLAMDCEMCETDREHAALVGLCVSDAKGEVLYKVLVRPRGNIVNLRTELTGITSEDLDTKPTVSRTQARKHVKALLLESWRAHKQPTILVGHALHHDLLALRLDHQPIIDTSLIFSYRGLPACTPGLVDLSHLVLRQNMPARGQGRHDSVEDATVSMRLVTHELERQQRTPPMKPPEIKVDKEDLCKLLVHSIPKSATEKDILALFDPQQNHATAAGAAPAPSISAAPAAGTGGQGEGAKGTGEASSDDDEDEDGDDEEQGSSSVSDSSSSQDESSGSSDSDSSDSDHEPPRKKQQKTPEQGAPNQQGGGSGAKTKPSAAASSSDSSDSESSESSCEEEEEGGGSGQAKGHKKQSFGAVGQGGAVSGSQVPRPIGFEGGGIENRRAVLLFRSPGDANTAFNSLVGTTDTDSNGRMNKEVPLSGDPTKSLRIRRMAAHNGLLFQVPKQARRPRPQKVAKELPTVGENGQPLTKGDKYRLRELMVKKGKTPQDLKKARHTGPEEGKTPQDLKKAVAAVAAGAAPPQGGGKQKKVTQKDLKKAAKKAARAQKKQKGGTPNKPSE